jgi:type II secretory pathway component PulJ
MRTKPGYLLVAVVLALCGAACLFWSKTQTTLAQTHLALATQRYAGLRETLSALEADYEKFALLPFARTTLAEVRADLAGLSYWQRDYRALLPSQGDPLVGIAPDNVRLQAIIANAVFRDRYLNAEDQKARVEALDAAIAAQLSVLRNVPDQTGVAYNYEYLVRLRGLAAGKNGPPKAGEGGDQGVLGHLGGEPQAADPTDLKIHVPLESRELQDQKDGREAGKTAPRERKG